MNYNLNNDGTGVGGILVLLYLIALAFSIGFMLVLATKGRARMWGFYLIVFGILASIVALLIYSSTRKDLW